MKRKVEQALAAIMPKDAASAFNQALMELGAKVCIPNGEPLCEQCPWQTFCEAKKQNIWHKLPVKKKTLKRKTEEISRLCYLEVKIVSIISAKV